MDINKRLQFFTKIFQRSTDLQTYVAKASGHVHEKPIGDADTTHKQRMDTPVYTTDRYATDINYAVSQFPDKSTAIVNNDVTARAKKVSQGHFTGASHYLVEEVMIENAAARGYTLMVTGWTGKGTLTKTVDGVVNEGPYAAGTQVVATFTPAAGYSFTSWGDGNTDNPRTFTMNSNIVTTIVTADIPQYALTFSATGEGTISATVGGTVVTSLAQVYVGSTVVLTATPGEGQEIHEWTGLPEGTVPVSGVATFTMPSVAVTASVSFQTATSAGPLKIEFSESSTMSVEWWNSGGGYETLGLKYSTDGSTWNDVVCEEVITVSSSIFFKGKMSDYVVRGKAPNLCFDSETECNLTISGDITTLLNETGNVSVLPDCSEDTQGVFSCLFEDIGGSSIDASGLVLPSTTLSPYCYAGMFDGCSVLTSAPASLPATTLVKGCYCEMFSNCTSLVTAPSLPATTLAKNCYQQMFQNCEYLTSAPVLPATTLAQSCYQSMFGGCIRLTGPVNIAATSPYHTGTTTACDGMFAYAGSEEAGGTINVGGNVSAWNLANCGIDTEIWTVQVPTE